LIVNKVKISKKASRAACMGLLV